MALVSIDKRSLDKVGFSVLALFIAWLRRLTVLSTGQILTTLTFSNVLALIDGSELTEFLESCARCLNPLFFPLGNHSHLRFALCYKPTCFGAGRPTTIWAPRKLPSKHKPLNFLSFVWSGDVSKNIGFFLSSLQGWCRLTPL